MFSHLYRQVFSLIKVGLLRDRGAKSQECVPFKFTLIYVQEWELSLANDKQTHYEIKVCGSLPVTQGNPCSGQEPVFKHLVLLSSVVTVNTLGRLEYGLNIE